MKKIIALALAVVMALALTIIATYRVVMNNLEITQVDNNIVIIEVFGFADEYTID